MMYFVIAAMKGEPGRPAGAGWAGCSGGRGGGSTGGGVGAPARAHVLPRAGRGSPARAFWATAAAPPEPGRGICLPPVGGTGARAGSPSSAPSGSCQSPRSAWHPARLPEESLPGVSALLEGRGGSGEFGGSRGLPRPVLRARTPDSSGLRREGAAVGPGRACARTRCHPWGLVSAPGLAPSPLGGPAARSARAAAGRESGAGPRCVPPRPLPKAPGPSKKGFSSVPRLPGQLPAAAAYPHLILWVVDGCAEATCLPTGFAGSGGG